MENKKFNKVIEEDLYCDSGEKFVIQCNQCDIKESADYKAALKLLDEHLKELHTESSTVQLIKRMPVKVHDIEVGQIDVPHDIEVGQIDVPIAAYNIMLERIKNPREEIERVWNDYLEVFFNEGRYSDNTFNLRIRLFDLTVRDKDVIEKKIRQSIGGN